MATVTWTIRAVCADQDDYDRVRTYLQRHNDSSNNVYTITVDPQGLVVEASTTQERMIQ